MPLNLLRRNVAKLFFTLTLALSVCVGSSLAIAGNEPLLIKAYDKWSAYQYTEGANNKVCFMISSPTEEKGNYTSRGEVYMLITHRPADKTRDVVSIIAGYTYKSGSTVTINIDGKIFRMITQGDTAWAEDGATDKRLAQAILRGNRMVITGTSTRGTLTTDTYSLRGSSKAYRAIGSACGIK